MLVAELFNRRAARIRELPHNHPLQATRWSEHHVLNHHALARA